MPKQTLSLGPLRDFVLYDDNIDVPLRASASTSIGDVLGTVATNGLFTFLNIFSGLGAVQGPASATDNAVARFDGTTGNLIQNSGVIIDDSDNVTGVVNLTASAFIIGGNTLDTNEWAFLDGQDQSVVSGSSPTFDGTNFTGVPTSGITGVLTDNSMADTLHRHSELSANDGTPDQALVVDATGNVGIGIATPLDVLQVHDVSALGGTLNNEDVIAWFTGNSDTATHGLRISQRRFATVGASSLVSAGIRFAWAPSPTSADINRGRVWFELGNANATSLAAQEFSWGINADVGDAGTTILKLSNSTMDFVLSSGFDFTIAGGDVSVVGITQLGDGGVTNYTEIEADGDVLFVGGGGLHFAEIWVKDNVAATPLNSSTGKVQYIHFINNGASNGDITPDHTNDHITIEVAGLYFCTLSIVVGNNAGASHVIDVSVWKNNGATEFLNVHAHRTLSASTDIGSISLSGVVNLAVNDTIELWLDTNRVVNTNVTVSDCTLSLIQIGGT